MVINLEKDKAIIYLFGFSSHQTTQLDKLLKIIKIQIDVGAIVKVILIHDGVIGTSKKGILPVSLKELLDLPVTVFAMIPDLKARGINHDNLHEQVKIIEYEELVDILVETPKVVSWM